MPFVYAPTQGTKYVANMWVWNGPRAGSWSRNSVTGKIEKPVPMGVSASFECVDIEGAQLYWEDQVSCRMTLL